MQRTSSGLRWRSALWRTSSGVNHSARTMPVSSARPGSGSTDWIAGALVSQALPGKGVLPLTASVLARFNTNIDVVDKRYFQGLPSPMAAAMLAGLVWVFDDLGIDRELWLSIIAWVFTMYAGITMVSNVPFYSFKEFNLKKAVPFWVVAVFAAGLAVISLKPSVVLFLMVFAYGVSGYVLWAMGRRAKPAV
jgi:hypothetical protein